MSEPVNIQVTTYNKPQFNQAINTGFTQFAPQVTNTPAPEDIIDVPEFFIAYQNLFLEIPKEGEINSHQYLVNTSKEYAGGVDISEEVLALTQEVTELREENIALQKQVLHLAELGSLNIDNITV